METILNEESLSLAKDWVLIKHFLLPAIRLQTLKSLPCWSLEGQI